MWSVKEKYKETVFAIPNVEFKAWEMTSKQIADLVELYPNMKSFFVFTEGAEVEPEVKQSSAEKTEVNPEIKPEVEPKKVTRKKK